MEATVSAALVAAKQGNEAELAAALTAGADLELCDEPNACTALHWAAYYGHTECVRVLLSRGADASVRAKDGCTPLHSAAARGHAAAARLLLDAGVEVDARDVDGETPLALAAARGHADMVRLLMTRGAAADAADAAGVTPVDVAVGDARAILAPAVVHAADGPSFKASPVLAELPDQLRRGARVAWLLSWTRAHDIWALPTWRVVQDLVVPATRGRACSYCMLPEAAAHFGVARVFVSHAWGAPWGSLVAAVAAAVPHDAHAWVDVFAICQHEGQRQREDLLALRSVVQAADVLLLVAHLTPPAARLLGGAGAPTFNALVAAGCGNDLPQLRAWCVFEVFTATQTPRPVVLTVGTFDTAARQMVPVTDSSVIVNLMNTVEVRQAQATQPADKTLILTEVEASAGVDALNAKVAGALLGAFSCAAWPEVVAAACGNPAPLAPLLAVGAAGALDERRGPQGQTATHAAAGAGFTHVLNALLAAGADAAAGNIMERTPLHRAAEGGHLQCIALLLDCPTVHIDCRDARGNTALYMAAAGGQVEALTMLHATGAQLHMRNAKGAGLLHTACVNAQAHMVRHLLTLGFDASAADDEANTPVMRACMGGSVPILEALVAAGASLDGADANGFTVALCAAYGGHTAVLRWLEARGAPFDGRTTGAYDGGAGLGAAALAVLSGSAEALDFILRRSGAEQEVHARDASGRSLEELAAGAGAAADMLRMLVDARQRAPQAAPAEA